VFPDCCIVCGRPESGHQASLFAAELRHGRSFLKGSYSLEVPCCVGCVPRLHVQRFLNGQGPLWIIAGGVTLMIALEYQSKSAGASPWVAGAVILSLLTVLRLAFPPALGIVPGEDVISFEFRNSGMAEEFRRLNPTADASGSLTRA